MKAQIKNLKRFLSLTLVFALLLCANAFALTASEPIERVIPEETVLLSATPENEVEADELLPMAAMANGMDNHHVFPQ